MVLEGILDLTEVKHRYVIDRRKERIVGFAILFVPAIIFRTWCLSRSWTYGTLFFNYGGNKGL